jgi:hypothetical protein
MNMAKLFPSPNQVGRAAHGLLRLLPFGSSTSLLLDKTGISRIPPSESELEARRRLLLAHTNAYLQSNENQRVRGVQQQPQFEARQAGRNKLLEEFARRRPQFEAGPESGGERIRRVAAERRENARRTIDFHKDVLGYAEQTARNREINLPRETRKRLRRVA